MGPFTLSAYLSMLIVGCILNLGALIVVWMRRSAQGGTMLAALLVSVLALLASTSFSMVSPNPQAAMFWHLYVRFTSLVLTGPLALLFLLLYVDLGSWRSRWQQALLFVIPVLTILLVWTNPYHHLFAQTYVMQKAGEFFIRAGWQPGLWFPIHAVYAYALFATALGIIILQLRLHPSLYRRQLWLVFAGVFLPVFLSAIDTLRLLPDARLQLLPFGLALSGPIFTLALTRYGLLDLIPIAYVTVFDSIEDPIIVLGSGERVIALNPAARRLFPASAEEVLGKELADILPNLARRLKGVDASQVRTEFEHQGHTYDSHLSPLQHRQQEPGSLLVLRDITAQKQAETHLRSLSKAIEHSPATVVITDTSGTIEYVNPKFTSITGYTVEEALGQNPRILKTDQTAPGVHKSLWETITAGGEWHGEFANRKKNGEIYWEAAAISPVFDDDGNITHFVAVKEDITSRKRIEAELARHRAKLETLVEERTAEVWESQHRYRALFEAANDAVFIMTLEGVHIEVNNTACQMLGYDRSELIGRSFRDTVAPDELAQSEAVLPRLLAGEAIPLYERRFQRKNGEVFPVEINVTLVKDRDGNPLNIQSIVRDITQRKQAEDALRDAYRQLMKLDDMKTEFIDSVSHELRTPITVLKIYHDLLEANPTKAQEYADTLQGQTSRLEEIVEGILFMQNIQQDLTDFNVATIDLSLLMSNAIEHFRQLTQPSGIEIFCHQTSDAIRLPGDPTLLRRAVTLLLDNGVKYLAEPGRVEVNIDGGVDGDPPLVMITITNPTKDLTADNIPRLFERFYRGANALTMGVSGAGLGLSIAREIVDRHQGALTASYDGHTFTVEIRLPRKMDQIPGGIP